MLGSKRNRSCIGGSWKEPQVEVILNKVDVCLSLFNNDGNSSGKKVNTY